MDYTVILALLVAILIVLTLQLTDNPSSYPVIGGHLSKQASVLNVLMFLLKGTPLNKEQQKNIYLELSKLSQYSSDTDEAVNEFVSIVTNCKNFSKDDLQKNIAALYDKTQITFTNPKASKKDMMDCMIIEETLDKLHNKLLTY